MIPWDRSTRFRYTTHFSRSQNVDLFGFDAIQITSTSNYWSYLPADGCSSKTWYQGQMISPFHSNFPIYTMVDSAAKREGNATIALLPRVLWGRDGWQKKSQKNACHNFQPQINPYQNLKNLVSSCKSGSTNRQDEPKHSGARSRHISPFCHWLLLAEFLLTAGFIWERSQVSYRTLAQICPSIGRNTIEIVQSFELPDWHSINIGN